MKALIVAPSWIGDAIMAQPLFRRLQADQPGLQIDALAPAWVAPAMARMPEISDLIDNPFAHGELALGKRRALGRELRAAGYDFAYILPNSLKSALLPWFAGIPQRVGFTGEMRFGLINRRHALDKAALPRMLDRFAQLAEAPGTPPRPDIGFPRLSTHPAAVDTALGKLGLPRPTAMVALCPGAEYGPAKRWPTGHFAALARKFAAAGHPVWVFGSAKDAAIAGEIAAQAPGCTVDLCGKTSLGEAIDLLSLASLVVCNDSGLMHVAAALDRPIVALYGSSSPGFTPPLSHRADIIERKLSCRPCFKRQCPLGHLDCLNGITPDEVFTACLNRMQDA